MTDPADSRAPDHVLDIVIPVHNEEHDLPGCVRRVHGYVCNLRAVLDADHVGRQRKYRSTRLRLRTGSPTNCPTSTSSISTPRAAAAALQTAWMKSPADVVAYMDVDLSTELSALMPLVAPVISGHSDLAIGSRLASSSRVDPEPET